MLQIILYETFPILLFLEIILEEWWSGEDLRIFLNIYFVGLKICWTFSISMGKPSGKKHLFLFFFFFGYISSEFEEQCCQEAAKRPHLWAAACSLCTQREACGQIGRCLLLAPKALPGETYTPGVSYVPRRELMEGGY